MSDRQHGVPPKGTYDRDLMVAALMVVAGSFILAFVDATNYTDTSGPRVGLVLLSAVLLFGSAYFLRRLRWWLFLYIPGVWLASGVLAVVLSVPAMLLASGVKANDECSGVNSYWDVVEDTSKNFESRLSYVQGSSETLSPIQWRTLINATDTDIENLNSYRVPDAAQAFNDQYIRVLEGWSDVFSAMSVGTYAEQMMFDLQSEDDEMETLQRQLSSACG